MPKRPAARSGDSGTARALRKVQDADRKVLVLVEAGRLELPSEAREEQASTSVVYVLNVPFPTPTDRLMEAVIGFCFPRRYPRCADR
jgi:hypothetical protein